MTNVHVHMQVRGATADKLGADKLAAEWLSQRTGTKSPPHINGDSMSKGRATRVRDYMHDSPNRPASASQRQNTSTSQGQGKVPLHDKSQAVSKKVPMSLSLSGPGEYREVATEDFGTHGVAKQTKTSRGNGIMVKDGRDMDRGKQKAYTPKASSVGFVTEMERGSKNQGQKQVLNDAHRASTSLQKDPNYNKVYGSDGAVPIVSSREMLDSVRADAGSALSWGDVREPVKTRKAQTHRLDMNLWTPLTGMLSLPEQIYGHIHVL